MNMQSTAIDSFLTKKTLALAGASRNGKKFGNTLLKKLVDGGYTVYPLHPVAKEIDGIQCVASVRDLPSDVQALLLVVQPGETEKLVREAKAAGIPNVWMQQGAESEAAIRFCKDHGMDVVHGYCLLLFLEPVRGIHRFHRWILDVFGKLPQ